MPDRRSQRNQPRLLISGDFLMKPILAIVLALLALAIATCMVAPARAHDAPAGWSYSPHCCSNKDCAMETAAVVATDKGWLVTATGEVVRYDDNRVKQSQDGAFHRCQVRNVTRLRCLYVPPMGF